MLDIGQFRSCVIQPTLRYLDLYSAAAEELLVGTAVQESGLCHLRQSGDGPALGVYQIEPATHDDLLLNYLARRHELRNRVKRLVAPQPSRIDQITINLAYATAVARLIYYRRPEPLPAPDDVEGLAGYWKQHFNTPGGKGTVSEFILNYREYVK